MRFPTIPALLILGTSLWLGVGPAAANPIRPAPAAQAGRQAEETLSAVGEVLLLDEGPVLKEGERVYYLDGIDLTPQAGCRVRVSGQKDVDEFNRVWIVVERFELVN